MPGRTTLRWAMIVVLLVGAFAAPGAALAGADCGTSYVVQSGDTLGSISQKCGLSVEAIVQMNPGAGFAIYPGQTLLLGNYPYSGYSGSYQSGSGCYSNQGMTICYADPGSAPSYGYNYQYPYQQYQYPYQQYQYPHYQYQYPYQQYQYPYYQHQYWYGCRYGNCYWNPSSTQDGCADSDCAEPESGDPVTFVRWYFNAVWQTRDYDSLWDLQTNTFKKDNSPGGYSDYTKWWDKVSYVTVNSVSLVHKAGNTARVKVALSFYMKNGKPLMNETYTYSLVYDEGLKSWKFQSK